MRLAEFGGGADPAGTDDKENLGENEIAQTERLLERFAVRFDIVLGALQVGQSRQIVSNAACRCV